MRPALFDEFSPVCPGTLMRDGREAPVRTATSISEKDGHLLSAVLHGGDGDMVQEYPVLDGAPLLIGDIRSYLNDHQAHLLMRNDLPAEVESIIGDGIGGGSLFDLTRQHLGTYAWDHYAGQDPAEKQGKTRPGASLRCLEAGLVMIGDVPDGPVLDAGCATGRIAFRLAERFHRPTLGIDLNFSMIRFAQSVLQTGMADYPRRRTGLVYDRRQFDLSLPGAELVDFWVGDLTLMPFAAESFALVSALNTVDSVSSPADFIANLARVTKPGGWLVMATPYDWSTAVTRTEYWVGGHSQRADDRGAGEQRLKSMLEEYGWIVRDEVRDQPWATRLHDRSTVEYSTHLIVAQKQG